MLSCSISWHKRRKFQAEKTLFHNKIIRTDLQFAACHHILKTNHLSCFAEIYLNFHSFATDYCCKNYYMQNQKSLYYVWIPFLPFLISLRFSSIIYRQLKIKNKKKRFGFKDNYNLSSWGIKSQLEISITKITQMISKIN